MLLKNYWQKKLVNIRVATGEIVNCDVDIAGINDLYLQTVLSFYEMGGEKVFDADKIVMFFDHYAPCATITQAENISSSESSVLNRVSKN